MGRTKRDVCWCSGDICSRQKELEMFDQEQTNLFFSTKNVCWAGMKWQFQRKTYESRVTTIQLTKTFGKKYWTFSVDVK